MSVRGAVEALFGLLLVPILQILLADEARAGLQRFSRALIRTGVQILPTQHRARYSEEWQAELDTFAKRPLRGLAYSIETVLSARRTGRVLRQAVGQTHTTKDQATDIPPLISTVPKLGRPPLMRPVDATRDERFDTFACRGHGPHVHRVNQIVALMRHDADKGMSVRVAEDPETGDLLGLCAVRREHPQLRPDLAFLQDAEYIGVIGLSDALGDTSIRLADFLIEDTLEQIVVRRHGQVPAVWTIVPGADVEGIRLFQSHGFEATRRKAAYALLVRSAGLQVSGTALFDWS